MPFLDHELVELAARIPTRHKVHRLQGKHVLRLAAKGLVPDFVLTKKKKGFFNEKVGAWLSPRATVVDRVLLKSDPAYAAGARPGRGAPRRQRVPRRARRERQARAGADRCSSCG